MKRRTMLATGLAAIAARGAAAAVPFFTAHHEPIGLQLYTLDPDLDRDFDGTLKAVAQAGFQIVELAGMHGRTPAQMRASLDAAGLVCHSAHIQPVQRGPDPSLASDPGVLAAAMHTIGVTDVVMPVFVPPAGVPPITGPDSFRHAGEAMTADDWKRNAAFLQSKAGRLKAEGLRLSYHNHNFEFKPFGHVDGMDILLADTTPGDVFFEMDVGWVCAGGGDPVAILQAHHGRFTQMHVKDIRATTKVNYDFRQDPAEVGQGVIPWARILPVAWREGVRSYYVEQEPPFTKPRLAAVTDSLHYLQTLQTG